MKKNPINCLKMDFHKHLSTYFLNLKSQQRITNIPAKMRTIFKEDIVIYIIITYNTYIEYLFVIQNYTFGEYVCSI